MKTVDTYNIYLIDANGDIYHTIKGLRTKIAQSWIDELKAENIQFELKLVVKQVEELV